LTVSSRLRPLLAIVITAVVLAALATVWLLRPVGRATAALPRPHLALADASRVCLVRCHLALEESVAAIVRVSRRVRHADLEAWRVVTAARSFLGVPYEYGGASRSGVDCSGLVMLAYRRAGIQLEHFSGAQWRIGRRVVGQLLPGDMVFFGDRTSPGHVGIYVGRGRYIHAPQTGDHVRIESLARRRDYLGARRILARTTIVQITSRSTS